VQNGIQFYLAILKKTIFADIPKIIASYLEFYADTEFKDCKTLSHLKPSYLYKHM